MPEHDEFDDRIRELLDRAVADAPNPPDLEGLTVTPNTEQNHRNRWLLGGATGLSIAAAIVAIFLFTRPDEVTAPLVPATNPSPTIAPPTPSDDSGTTVPENGTADPGTTEPSTGTGSTTSTSTPTTEPTSSSEPDDVATSPTEPRPADVRLISGPDGVEILGPESRRVTDEPMAVARLGPDDSVYMQRSTVAENADGSAADTRLLVVVADGQAPVPVDVDLPIEGSIRLHDTARIDGRWVVLFEIAPPRCANPDGCIGGIYVYRPDDGSVEEIQRKSVWESGWESLSLSETGVIVGGETESASRSPYIASVAGTPGPVPDITTLGLDQSYDDCSGCPQGYAINRRGDAVAWIQENLDGSALVRVVGLDGAPRGEGRIEPGCCGSAIVPVVSLGDVEIAEDITRPIVIVNEEYRDPTVNPDSASFASIYVDVEIGEVDVAEPGTNETYE